MKVYFCCTYENSLKGFSTGYLTRDGFVPTDEDIGKELPRHIYEFFSYDKFKMLWREYPENEAKIFFPSPSSGVFVMKRIPAVFENRKGIVNIAITADNNELKDLEKIVVSILGNYNVFSAVLSKCLSIGGICGYDINEEIFYNYLDECTNKTDFQHLHSFEGGKLLLNILKQRNGIYTQRDLIRFIATNENWKDIRSSMGSGFIWKRPPKCLITQTQFEDKFIINVM